MTWLRRFQFHGLPRPPGGFAPNLRAKDRHAIAARRANEDGKTGELAGRRGATNHGRPARPPANPADPLRLTPGELEYKREGTPRPQPGRPLVV
jgi:hypothetical protein